MNALIKRLLAEGDDDDAEVQRHLGHVVSRITAPYTEDALRTMTNNGAEYLVANVGVALWDLVEHDLEWLNDYTSEQITGSTAALEDIGFKPVGVDGEEVVIQVTASVLTWITDRGMIE